MNNADLSSRLAIDAQSLNQLKLDAKTSSPAALKAAAKQFEAVFMNMLMKSMREGAPQDGVFDNDQTKMYTAMLDQQLSQRMADRGIGLADVMVRQLSAAMKGIDGATLTTATTATTLAPKPDAQATSVVTPAITTSAITTPAVKRAPSGKVDAFVQRLLPHAEAASADSGIPARFMLGQAALETGWGAHEIRAADGSNSHNLFGIKAGTSWHGKTAQVTTTEYVNGVAQKQVDSFRAYDSYADAFRDYANLLRGNARYQNVVGQGQDAAGFAQGLQQAGYATDPNYAQKLISVIRQFGDA
jgi:flagellar protein FlgJ